MPFIILLGGLGAVWALSKTDLLIPAFALLVVGCLVWAASPEAAMWLLLAVVGCGLLAGMVAFLPQVLGAIVGIAVFFMLFALLVAGVSHAGELVVVKQGINIMQKMDADTCNEVESDEIENIYNEQAGWKLKLGGKIPGGWTDSVHKGSRTITFTCQNGYFIRRDSAEPIMDGQVEYMK